MTRLQIFGGLGLFSFLALLPRFFFLNLAAMLEQLLSPLVHSFFIAGLQAQESAPAPAAPAGGGGVFGQGIGLLLIFAIFFLLIIWPQHRKAKKHAALLAGLEKGDEVVTNSGIFGKVVGLADRVVTLEIAPNVKIRVDRQSIASKDSGTTAEPKAASS